MAGLDLRGELITDPCKFGSETLHLSTRSTLCGIVVIVVQMQCTVGLVEKIYKRHKNIVRRGKHDKKFFSTGRLIVNEM